MINIQDGIHTNLSNIYVFAMQSLPVSNLLLSAGVDVELAAFTRFDKGLALLCKK